MSTDAGGDGNSRGRSKLSQFFAKKWWAGIGVVVAILAALWGFFDTGPTPRPPTLAEELQQRLSNVSDDPVNHLVVHNGQTFTVNETEAIYRSVTLGDNSKLELSPELTRWNLQTLKLKVGQNVQILGRGKDGDEGRLGSPGDHSPRDCSNGNDGTEGKRGVRGTNGIHIDIKTIDLNFVGRLTVDTSGGSGGKGGDGGNGGNGGRADRSDRCSGGNGGRGGEGGDGGNAGSGGNLSISYVHASADGEGPIDQWTNYITHLNSAGSVGLLGSGGQGGDGGAGRGASLVIDGQPGGSNGNAGNSGESGNPGSAGSTQIAPGRS